MPEELHQRDLGMFSYSRDCACFSMGSETFLVVTPVSPQISCLTGTICQVPFHLALCNPGEDKGLVLWFPP